MKRSVALSLLSLALSYALVRPVVLAQAPEPTDLQSTIVNKPDISAQILDVQQTYRGHLEEYRRAEQAYLLAKGQYEQLDTLVSLEEAVKATREALIKRTQVLKTYMTLMRLQLINGTGISLEKKDPALAKLQQMETQLDAYAEQITQANDRNQVQAVAVSFEELGTQVDLAAHEALTLLSIGRLQTVYDKTVSLESEIKQNESTQSADLKQAERERAFAETDRALLDVRTEIADLEARVDQEKGVGKTSYQRVVRDLGPVYAGLARSLSFLTELIRL